MRSLALRQTCQPRSDRGKARHSVSSTSAHHNLGSSSHQGDDDEDDGASRAKLRFPKPPRDQKSTSFPPKQFFIDLTNEDTITPSPKLQESSHSAPNAPSKTPSTKDTSSSSIDYTPKSPTLSSSPSTNGYLNPPLSLPPRVSPPPLTQENASMDITLTLSPITPLDVKFDTPSPSPPIVGHPIP
ncbi:hypothetical protein Tco_0323298 [Tanacetum coccineum]